MSYGVALQKNMIMSITKKHEKYKKTNITSDTKKQQKYGLKDHNENPDFIFRTLKPPK